MFHLNIVKILVERILVVQELFGQAIASAMFTAASVIRTYLFLACSLFRHTLTLTITY